jgi:hypothetical protein
MTKKVVLFRYCVLVPIDQKEQQEYVNYHILGIRDKKKEMIPPSKNLLDMNSEDEPEQQGADLMLLNESLGLTVDPPKQEPAA